MLIGYGAHALCPYLAYETARQWRLSSRTQSLVKSGKVCLRTVGCWVLLACACWLRLVCRRCMLDSAAVLARVWAAAISNASVTSYNIGM